MHSMPMEIGGRQQAEQTAARYGLLAEHTQDIILFIGEDGRIVDANEAAISAYGYDRDTLLTLTIKDLCALETLPQVESQMAKTWPSSIRFKTMHRRANGTTFPVEVTSGGSEFSGQPLLFSVVREITERRRNKEASKGIGRLPDEHSDPILRVDGNGVLLYANSASYTSLGGWQLTLGEPVLPLLREAATEALEKGQNKKIDIEHAERVFSFFVVPVHEANYVNLYGSDITARQEYERTLIVRELQQAAIAHFGQIALSTSDVDSLLDAASSLVAQILHVEYATVLKLLPGGEELLLVAGEGWEEGIVGSATVWTGSNSHFGYTLASKVPVIIEDLKTETRFDPSPLMRDSGIVSGLSVIIQQNEKTWGVMGAYTTMQREFTSDDATFLSAVANILSLALDRRTAEDKVTRLATVVEQSGDSIVITDTTGNIQYVNPGFEQTTGYSIQEVMGKNPSIMKSGKESPAFYKQLWDTIAAGQEWTGHFSNKKKDGSLYEEDATISPVRDDTGKIVAYVAVKRDVTEHMRADEQMRQQALLLDLAPVLVRDMQHRIVFWSKGLEQLYGYTSGEAMGRTVDKLLWTELPVPLTEIEETLHREGLWEGELIRRSRDGNRITVTSRWLLHRDFHGTPLRILEVDSDVTLRRGVEEEIKKWNVALEQRVAQRTAELRDAKERAEVASRAKSDFLANMSHELRTPLNAIIGFSELLVDQKLGALNPQQDESINDILTSGRHLLDLITDILDLTKIVAGKLEFKPQPFSISEAMVQACMLVKDIARQKKIKIDIEKDLDSDEVTLDPLRFKQVLYNLVSNAVKYTPDNGGVTIRVLKNSHEPFQLQVSDTGIGITKEDLPRIFCEFEQIDSSLAKRAQGTGLGLALTKKIVELQKGSISVESEVGMGSTFTVILPVSP